MFDLLCILRLCFALTKQSPILFLEKAIREVVKSVYFTVRLTVSCSKNTFLGPFEWVKFFTFAYGQGRGAEAAPHGQPEHKISVFFDSPKKALKESSKR